MFKLNLHLKHLTLYVDWHYNVPGRLYLCYIREPLKIESFIEISVHELNDCLDDRCVQYQGPIAHKVLRLCIIQFLTPWVCHECKRCNTIMIPRAVYKDCWNPVAENLYFNKNCVLMFGSHAFFAGFNHANLSIFESHKSVHQLGDCPPLNLSLTWGSRERQSTGHGLKSFSLRRVIII